jgi:hypothetical protein
VPVPIRQSGIACHPALVINTVSPAARPAKRIEVGYLILRSCLRLYLSLCLRQRYSRSATESDQNNEQNFASSFGCELCCHFFALLNFLWTTLYGLPLSHHQSHFARFVRAISLLIHGSINESSGTISVFFAGSRIAEQLMVDRKRAPAERWRMAENI